MRRTALSALILIVSASTLSAGPPARDGLGFQVNTYTSGYQYFTAVDQDPNGNFVVVWLDDYELVGRLFDRTGSPLGSEFQVSTYSLYSPFVWPDVAMDASGDFVVVWSNSDSSDPNNPLLSVRARRFDSSGSALDPSDFQVNTYSVYAPGYYAVFQKANVTSDDQGNFVVVWSDPYGGYGVTGSLFESDGDPVTGDFAVSAYPGYFGLTPDVAMTGTGDFVVVWTGYADPNTAGIVGRRFDSSAVPKDATGFRIDSDPNGLPIFPAVDTDAAGNFVVAWEHIYSGDCGIRGRRVDSSGTPLGPGEFRVSSPATGGYGLYGLVFRAPEVSMNASGEFVVAWSDYEAYFYSDADVFARRYDDTGSPESAPFQVNAYTTYVQFTPSVTLDDAGDFLVVWSGAGATDNVGIFAQRFAAEGTCGLFDTDGDGLNDGCDILLTVPFDGATLDCSDPATTRPRVRWSKGRYDRFRAVISWDPGFAGSMRITSGRTFIRRSTWMPTRRQWERACNNVGSTFYVRVFGIDNDVRKRHPRRTTLSNRVETTPVF
jgi:hypothetical protein